MSSLMFFFYFFNFLEIKHHLKFLIVPWINNVIHNYLTFVKNKKGKKTKVHNDFFLIIKHFNYNIVNMTTGSLNPGTLLFIPYLFETLNIQPHELGMMDFN